MPLTFIDFKGNKYPEWQSKGNAARWIMPLAKELLHGKGYDIGYSKEAWMFPGAIGIEPTIDHRYDAMRLPDGEVDYIFSSHCLEHVQRNWYDVIDYWLSKIRVGGLLFLYLPHSSQVYWQPENNRKHIHSFDGFEIETYLNDLGHKVYVSQGPDFNNSFVVVCEKIDRDTKLTKQQTEELKAALKAAQSKPEIFPVDLSATVKKGDGITAWVNLPYNQPDSNGDVLMPGCFDKSIKAGEFQLESHLMRDFTEYGIRIIPLIKSPASIENFELTNVALKEACHTPITFGEYNSYFTTGLIK